MGRIMDHENVSGHLHQKARKIEALCGYAVKTLKMVSMQRVENTKGIKIYTFGIKIGIKENIEISRRYQGINQIH